MVALINYYHTTAATAAAAAAAAAPAAGVTITPTESFQIWHQEANRRSSSDGPHVGHDPEAKGCNHGQQNFGLSSKIKT